MKTFNQYIKQRNFLSIVEMARPPVNIGGDETVEVKKVPIFFDHNDIEYLKKFPEELWAQALRKKYMLLPKVHEFRIENEKLPQEKKKTFPDIQDIILNYKGSKKKYKVDTKINELYDKLSGDADEQKFIRSRKINDLLYRKGRILFVQRWKVL